MLALLHVCTIHLDYKFQARNKNQFNKVFNFKLVRELVLQCTSNQLNADVVEGERGIMQGYHLNFILQQTKPNKLFKWISYAFSNIVVNVISTNAV